MSTENTPRNNIERSRQTFEQSQESTDEAENNLSLNTIVPNNTPDSSSDQTLTQIDQRRALKVRKVKSELKYIDPPVKDAEKRTISKSDHEFSNENDVSIFLHRLDTN